MPIFKFRKLTDHESKQIEDLPWSDCRHCDYCTPTIEFCGNCHRPKGEEDVLECLEQVRDVDLASSEEIKIYKVILAARQIQDFLWADMNQGAGLEEFRRMFRKRLAKIEQIDLGNPHWRVELNKRLLQTAAIAVNMMEKIDNGLLTHDGIHSTLPSNLPEYSRGGNS